MDARIVFAGGIALGVLVVIWQVIAAAAGLGALFPLVATLIEVVVLVGALAQTRSTQGYAAQVGSGVAMAGIACVLIVPGALIVGASSADVVAGAVGTVVSGVVIALLAAIPLRRRSTDARG